MVQFFKSIANEFFIEEDKYICCVLEGLDHMSYHILCYFSVTAMLPKCYFSVTLLLLQCGAPDCGSESPLHIVAVHSSQQPAPAGRHKHK